MAAPSMSTRLMTIAAACVAGPLAAQVEWVGRTSRTGNGLVADTAAGKLLMFGGVDPANNTLTDTWLSVAGPWQRVAGVPMPPLSGFAYAYHGSANLPVLFGGRLNGPNGTLSGSTWVFTGGNWSQHGAVLSPQPRTGAAMSYHAGLQRIVLFGGTGASGILSDTWEFDGFLWAHVPINGPASVSGPVMAYDASRARTVMCYSTGAGGGTFEYDGGQWTQMASIPVSGNREGLCMVSDPSGTGVLIFGGQDTHNGTWLNELWRWNGTQYALLVPAPNTPVPLPRRNAVMAFDPVRNRAVLMGGQLAIPTHAQDAWEWNGTNWSVAPVSNPTPRNAAAMAYDESQDEIVIVGGEYEYYGPHLIARDCWARSNGQWRVAGYPQAGATTAGDLLQAMTFDAARNQLVLFGGVVYPAGSGTTGATNSTWLRTGGQWTQATPTNRPPARFLHAMAYDRQRARVVLFGGGTGFVAGYMWPQTSYFADTWEWDGLNWMQVGIGLPGPSLRVGHGMAYDEARGKTILFGGDDGRGTSFTDTWEWDGQTWTQRSPTHSPPSQASPAWWVHVASMVYDAARQRIVLSPDWEWDGADWTQRQLPSLPPNSGTMAYDRQSRRTVWFGGGVFGWRYRGEVWEFGPATPAMFSTFGQGCVGTIGLPRLSAASAGPWLGSDFDFLLDGVTSTPSLFAIGFSDTFWNGIPLPIDLSPIGIGCDLLIDVALVWGVNPGVFRLSIPPDQALLGARIFAQAACYDPLVPGNMVLSNAAAATIGGL